MPCLRALRVRLSVAPFALLASLLAAPAAQANALCRVEQPLLLSYPAADTLSVPRNAQLLFVLDPWINQAVLHWPDGSFTLQDEGGALPHFRFDTGERLVPGMHELTLSVRGSSSVQPLDTDTFSFRFRVDDVAAPEPDETSHAAITRISILRRWLAGVLQPDPIAVAAALEDPGDCSPAVAAQIYGVCGGASDRQYRVELEAEGPALGYAINDVYFLPAGCRSAFLPELAAPFRVRVITETGLGTNVEYAGGVEMVVSREPDRFPPRSADAPEATCSATGGPGTRGTGMAAALALMATGLGWRRARRRQLALNICPASRQRASSP